MKLISTTDFVLGQNKETRPAHETLKMINNYANFLKQILELWMFVPCDEDGNVLGLPKEHLENRSLYYRELEQYQQSKERVLFAGFSDEDLKEIEEWFTAYFGGKTIENLLNGSYKDIINLTETALKQIGL